MVICSSCEREMNEQSLRCQDSEYHLPEHLGICCDCFDVEMGDRPKVRLKGRTPINWEFYEDFNAVDGNGPR